MPHITVKPFNSSKLKLKKYSKTRVFFKSKDLMSNNELIGVEIYETRFLLHLKKAQESWLLKYEKITRPLNVNLIKEAISDISKELNLDIINSNIAIRENKTKLANKYKKSIEDFIDIKFPFNTISIEIGFGSGKHLLHQAINNPNELFIGIEIHIPSAQQVLRQIELQDINNIWIVNYDARLFLEIIPSNIIHKIFVHFPIPWDKKPHRRVISSSFLDESMRVLKKDGRLELRTDSYKYFWYSLDIFLNQNVLKTTLEIRKNESLEVTSKYEARWLKEQKDIYDIFVTSKENSKKRVLNFDFNFDEIRYKESILNHIDKKPIIFDNFFIHFEKFYQINENSILIKVSFGSFHRPEHKYIFIDNTNSYYFGLKPVKTFTNYKTHLKIKEYLNV